MNVTLWTAFGAILGGAAGPAVVQLTSTLRSKRRSKDQRRVEHQRRLAIAYRAAGSVDPTVRATGLALLDALRDRFEARIPGVDLGP